MKYKILSLVIIIICFGFGVNAGRALCEELPSDKHPGANQESANNALLLKYKVGPSGQFEKFNNNIYIYIGKEIRSSSYIEINRLSRRAGVDLTDYTIKPIIPNIHSQKLAEISSVLDRSKYWYRLLIISSKDHEYFMIEGFSVKKTSEYYGPAFEFLSINFEPDVSCLIGKNKDTSGPIPERSKN